MKTRRTLTRPRRGCRIPEPGPLDLPMVRAERQLIADRGLEYHGTSSAGVLVYGRTLPNGLEWLSVYPNGSAILEVLTEFGRPQYGQTVREALR